MDKNFGLDAKIRTVIPLIFVCILNAWRGISILQSLY